MTEHPCGALPVSGWSVSVWYCHTHQAYFASQSSYIQSGDDAVEQLSADDKQWGPFDSYTAAREFVCDHAYDIYLLAGDDQEDFVAMVVR